VLSSSSDCDPLTVKMGRGGMPEKFKTAIHQAHVVGAQKKGKKRLAPDAPSSVEITKRQTTGGKRDGRGGKRDAQGEFGFSVSTHGEGKNRGLDEGKGRKAGPPGLPQDPALATGKGNEERGRFEIRLNPGADQEDFSRASTMRPPGLQRDLKQGPISWK